MPTLLFAASLIALAALGLLFPAAFWFSIAGAIVVTGVWLYFSLRNPALDLRSGPPDLEDSTLLNIGADADINDGSHG